MITTTTRPTTRTAPTTRRRPLRAAAAAAVAAVLLGACAAPVADPEPATPTTPTAPEQSEPAPDVEPAPEPATPTETVDEPAASDDEPVGPGLVVRAAGDLDVYDDPGADAPSLTLPATTSFGSPRALLVTAVGDADADGWLEVLLPVRPNGSTGWIRDDAVELHTVDVRVAVDLDARELTVLEGDEVVLSTPVAIGNADHPTPTGTFYVTDKLDTADPDGPYGPYALGLSAWSDVLTEFAGGDGQVGIHGTNVPSSIGQAASHGCVRVANDVIEQLVALLPLGTPVTIS